MRICRLSLENFRNIGLAHLDFDTPSTYFVGPNGQGKTNILEAAGFITALRSFRNQYTSALIAHDQPQAQLLYTIEHEHLGLCQVRIVIGKKSKRILVNDEPVTKLSGFLGLFPTVTLSAEDMQWVRGAPGLRRRFMDISLASMDSQYLEAVKCYQQCLDERNALLKTTDPDEASLEAFEQGMVERIGPIMQARTRLVDFLNTHLQSYYNHMSPRDESPAISYRPNLTGDLDLSTLRERFRQARARDRLVKSTGLGPHRDDFSFHLQSTQAREYASEGQQRTLVIALRLAQMAYFEACSKVSPVVLADDVLGQLDTNRRERFWSLLGDRYSLMATGTVFEASHAQAGFGCWCVDQGVFKRS